MSVIKTLVFVGVSLYLAFIFGMAGANKLYPVDPATHKYLVRCSCNAVCIESDRCASMTQQPRKLGRVRCEAYFLS
jgi:hypothetical protein